MPPSRARPTSPWPQIDSERRKTQNRIAHSAPGSVQLKPARKKKVVAELE